MRTTAAIVVCALTAPAAAIAGRTRYGALHDTEVQVERNVEIATWIYEDNEEGATETRWAIGPLLGLDDRIELGFPVEFAKLGTGATELDRYGAELRYRLVAPDFERGPAFVPLVRIAVNRVVSDHEVLNLQGGLGLSYRSGRLHVLAEAGVSGDMGRDETEWELRPGVGTSIRVIGELRLGVEAFGEIALADRDETAVRASAETEEGEENWLAVGPNLAWTHGRFWISASYGIGVVGIDSAPRMQWGIAF